MRCKTKVSVTDTANAVCISMLNQLNNSTQIVKIYSESGKYEIQEASLENLSDYDMAVVHDSAVLLHSDDKCAIQIHDYLHPFLL